MPNDSIEFSLLNGITHSHCCRICVNYKEHILITQVIEESNSSAWQTHDRWLSLLYASNFAINSVLPLLGFYVLLLPIRYAFLLLSKALLALRTFFPFQAFTLLGRNPLILPSPLLLQNFLSTPCGLIHTSCLRINFHLFPRVSFPCFVSFLLSSFC